MKEFFLNAYLSPPPKMQENQFDGSLMEKGYSYLSEAGFTHCLGFYEQYGTDNDEVKRAINLADKHNISYLIYDKDFCGNSQNEEAFAEHLNELQNYPYGGHFIFDEPGRKQFTTLQQMLVFYEQNSKNKLAYVNLQPLNSPANYLEYGMWTKENQFSATYVNYMDDYIKLCAPSYLSYDFYPFYTDEKIKVGYFEQLDLISKLSKKHQIPFYSYIQSCSWENKVRIPTYEEVIWQCGMSLCYGAKGLQYFCFFTPYANGEMRRDVAMLDFDCKPTERYQAAKTFNLFLKKIENKLFLMSHVKTSEGEGFSFVKSIQGNCLAGFYEGDNDGVFVTNKSFEQSESVVIELVENCKCTLFGFFQDRIIKEENSSVHLLAGESVFLCAEGRRI